MNILYIILKYVVWRFQIYNYFREIFKFRDFINTLRDFAKSVFAHIFEKVIIYSKSSDHVLENDISVICSYFKSLKFFRTAVLEPFRENCS